jgi:hypothetical protein
LSERGPEDDARPDLTRAVGHRYRVRGHREGTPIFRRSRSADPVPRFETRLASLADPPGALAAWGEA